MTATLSIVPPESKSFPTPPRVEGYVPRTYGPFEQSLLEMIDLTRPDPAAAYEVITAWTESQWPTHISESKKPEIIAYAQKKYSDALEGRHSPDSVVSLVGIIIVQQIERAAN